MVGKICTTNACVGPGNARQQFLGVQERRSPTFPLTLTTEYMLKVMISRACAVAQTAHAAVQKVTVGETPPTDFHSRLDEEQLSF